MSKKVALIAVGYELIGLEVFAALLKARGHEVRLFYDPGLFDDHFYVETKHLGKLFSQSRKIAQKVVDYRPDVVGMTVFTETFDWARQMIEWIKPHAGARFILGGAHATLEPSACLELSRADAVCVGEGWRSFVDFVESDDPNAKIDNIYTRKDDGPMLPEAMLLEDLDSLPFADKTIFENDYVIADNFSVITSLGCPYRCNFCINNYLHKIHRGLGKILRRRSVNHVMAELAEGKKRYDFRFVSFVDDTLFLDKEWSLNLLEQYAGQIGEPFYCLAHVRNIDWPLIDALKAAGCARLEFGVQTFHEPSRKHFFGLDESTGKVIKALKMCRDADLPVCVDYIVGIPGADRDSYEEAISAFARYKVQRVACFWLHYFPKIAITDIALEKGYITRQEYDEVLSGRLPSYHMNRFVKDKKQVRYLKSVVLRCKLLAAIGNENSPLLRSPLLIAFYGYLPLVATSAIEFAVSLYQRNYLLKGYLANYRLQLKKFFWR